MYLLIDSTKHGLAGAFYSKFLRGVEMGKLWELKFNWSWDNSYYGSMLG